MMISNGFARELGLIEPEYNRNVCPANTTPIQIPYPIGKCNCHTKTPIPDYHARTCPVWLRYKLMELASVLQELMDSLDQSNIDPATFEAGKKLLLSLAKSRHEEIKGIL